MSFCKDKKSVASCLLKSVSSKVCLQSFLESLPGRCFLSCQVISIEGKLICSDQWRKNLSTFLHAVQVHLDTLHVNANFLFEISALPIFKRMSAQSWILSIVGHYSRIYDSLYLRKYCHRPWNNWLFHIFTNRTKIPCSKLSYNFMWCLFLWSIRFEEILITLVHKKDHIMNLYH